MRLYKVLKVRRHSEAIPGSYYFSPYQNFDYGDYLPENGKPGKWTPKLRGMPRMCRRGWHVTTSPKALIRGNLGAKDDPGFGISYEVYVAEGRGISVRGTLRGERDKVAFQSIRLIKRAHPWFEKPNPMLRR